MIYKKIDDGTLDHVYFCEGPKGKITLRFSTDCLDGMTQKEIRIMLGECYEEQAEEMHKC